MLIKDITPHLFDVATNNNSYNSDPWFLYALTRVPSYIKRRCSIRPLFPWIESAEDPANEAADIIDALLEAKAYTYRHMWELYTAEYNPIWNYDGSEKEVYSGLKGGTKGNTGTQTSAKTGSITRSDSGTDTVVKSGNVTSKDTGDTTDVKTGNVTSADTGTDTLTNGKVVTESATTYDSASFLDARKSTASGDDKTTYGKTTTETYNQLQDKLTLNTTNTETYNNVQDQRTLNTSHTETYNTVQDQRTDNLTETTSGTESYTRELFRGGNQGTTMTQEMEQAELSWLDKFNLLETIAVDIANEISYCYY